MAGGAGTHRARLLVLGAGPAQLGLLEAARARSDVELIVADRDPGAPGFALADECAVVSTEDEQEIERLARARGVDGIVSPGADWTVGVAARVAERMGLPHPLDAATAALATVKTRQRERFAAAGVPHARAFDPLGEIAFPCVVKAPDRQGQRGLTLVRSRPALAAALELAAAESRDGTVLVEELVEGPEVTVIGTWHDGSFVLHAVTDRIVAAPPAFGVALAHVWPSAQATGAAAAAAERACAALGVRRGPVYVQVRLGAGGPRVMEVAARLGGGHDAELVEAVTGVDLNDLAVSFALGRSGRVAPGGEGPSNRLSLGSGGGPGGACIRFLVPPEGTLVAVEGVEEAEAVAGVRWVRVYRRPGWRFGAFRRGADRAGAVLATGASRTEAIERARRAADTVRFRVDADAP